MVALRKENQVHVVDFRQQALDLIDHYSDHTTIITFPSAFLGLLDYQLEACVLLNQILFWSSRTRNHEGWFYKSYDEWQQEVGLSRYQINRAINGDARTVNRRITLREIGVETSVRRTPNGNPTVHYRIDMLVFLGYLEAYLETLEMNTISNNVTERNETNSQNEMKQTHSSSLNKDKQVIYQQDHMERLDTVFYTYEHVYGQLAQIPENVQNVLREIFVQLGEESVQEVLMRCADYGNSWYYVLAALQNETSARKSNIDDTESRKQARTHISDDTCANKNHSSVMPPSETINVCSMDWPPGNWHKPKIDVHPSERIHTPWIDLSGEERGTLEYAWEIAVMLLDSYVSGECYRAGVRCMRIVDYDEMSKSITFVAENKLAQMLTTRHMKSIRQVLCQILTFDVQYRVLMADEWFAEDERNLNRIIS